MKDVGGGHTCKPVVFFFFLQGQVLGKERDFQKWRVLPDIGAHNGAD